MYVPDVQAASVGEHERECGIHFEDGDRWSHHIARRLVGARSLAHSIRNKQLYRWWYLAEHDPLHEHLRRDPRFQALDEQARQHVEQQRSLLEEMRRRGTVPRRSS